MAMSQRPGRDELTLVSEQLAGVERWHRTRVARSEAAESVAVTREMRLDLRRRAESRRREQQALVSRAEAQMRESRALLGRVRAVVAHRSDFLRRGVAEALEREGVRVVAQLDNGADALGLSVVEQPDLLLVDELLPSLTGLEVVREMVQLSPRTAVGGCAEGDAGVRRLLEAGARAAFTRRVTPQQVAAGLLASVR
jgi:CheY-like chemotaxis protein